MTYEDTPLGRAADVLRRELFDYLSGWGDTNRDRFTHKLASDVIGAARLPEELDQASELRTANLIAIAGILTKADRGNEAWVITQKAMTRLGIEATQ